MRSQFSLNWTTSDGSNGLAWSTTFKAYDNAQTLAFGQHFPDGIPRFSTNATASGGKTDGQCEGQGRGEGGCWGRPGSGFPTLDLTAAKMASLGFINYGEIGITRVGNDWSKY
eukprot:gene2467-9643_t